MSKHTPGPWTADPSTAEDGGFCIRPHREDDGGMTGFQIVYIHPDHVASVWRHYNSSVEADARLISAAPDLLEALKELIEEVGAPEWLATKIRLALAKAEGR